LLTGEAGRWMADGLLHLKDFGFAVEESAAGSAPGASGLAVKTTLTRAYTWAVGIKLFSMVAMKAQFQDRNGVLQEKFYRAYGDKTNMWGANSEFVTTLLRLQQPAAGDGAGSGVAVQRQQGRGVHLRRP
jgi:hypothetical protein